MILLILIPIDQNQLFIVLNALLLKSELLATTRFGASNTSGTCLVTAASGQEVELIAI
jgi:hypothetical protein